jgi:hypothetical protein
MPQGASPHLPGDSSPRTPHASHTVSAATASVGFHLTPPHAWGGVRWAPGSWAPGSIPCFTSVLATPPLRRPPPGSPPQDRGQAGQHHHHDTDAGALDRRHDAPADRRQRSRRRRRRRWGPVQRRQQSLRRPGTAGTTYSRTRTVVRRGTVYRRHRVPCALSVSLAAATVNEPCLGCRLSTAPPFPHIGPVNKNQFN